MSGQKTVWRSGDFVSLSSPTRGVPPVKKRIMRWRSAISSTRLCWADIITPMKDRMNGRMSESKKAMSCLTAEQIWACFLFLPHPKGLRSTHSNRSGRQERSCRKHFPSIPISQKMSRSSPAGSATQQGAPHLRSCPTRLSAPP